ncbi:MAG: hypothetical protein M3447_08975 [Acidobacteriota bacterium]|nr:hypothetical protein [Acidobacteriota bacterium]
MTAIRLYLTVLTLAFFLAVVLTTGIDVLEATVMTTVPLLLILDMREELSTVRSLENQLAALSR